MSRVRPSVWHGGPAYREARLDVIWLFGTRPWIVINNRLITTEKPQAIWSLLICFIHGKPNEALGQSTRTAASRLTHQGVDADNRIVPCLVSYLGMDRMMKRWNSLYDVCWEEEKGLGEVVLSKKKEGVETAALIGRERPAPEFIESTNQDALFGVSSLGSGAPAFGVGKGCSFLFHPVWYKLPFMTDNMPTTESSTWVI